MNRIHPLPLIFLAFAVSARGAEAPKPNVLFFAVDDLRPALGCYGDKLAKTPNIDRLAASGFRFERAYCQQAVCAPSRNALLTGIRPETMKIHGLGTFFRTALPDAVTLPQHFKANGYTAARFGKIFHTGHGNRDDERSWSDPTEKARPGGKKSAGAQSSELIRVSNVGLLAQAGKAGRGRQLSLDEKQKRSPTGAPDVADNRLGDGKTADAAIARLGELKDTPFFLAVGFTKPHLSFVAPKKYWDLFDRAQFPLPRHRTPPEGAPRAAYHGPGELLSYAVTKEELTDAKVRELIHGYYAATAYMDAQVGRVLAELDRLGLAEKTIVVFWSDHGYQLGEHGEWAKHNTTELSTRIPLIVRAPGNTQAGTSTPALVETVDLYPSLCDLAGLPVRPELEGTSFAPLFADPQRAWKKAAFSVWPMRERKEAGKRQDTGLGHAMRTDRYRFVEWAGEFELYDHQSDPDEHVNLADKPEHKELAAKLTAQLHAGWKAAQPETRP